MKLSIEYLKQRHEFWKKELSDKGIWEAELFKPVTIVIRPDCKSYNGMFIRRYLKQNGKRVLVDRIFIYNKTEDFETSFLDSVLVHEMIHQYIYQAGLKDSSSHGKLFREFMHKINRACPDTLKIKISDKNPSLPTNVTGDKRHIILILNLNTGYSYCTVINPAKLDYFIRMLKRDPLRWNLKSFSLGETFNTYFNNFRRCTKSLHGIKKKESEMEKFCREMNITITKNYLIKK